MKGFYITGNKGAYIELEDGRMADTVVSAVHPPDLGEPHEVLAGLLAEMTYAFREPLFVDCSRWELAAYVDASLEREESLTALAEMTGVPYNTLAKAARMEPDRFKTRKSGGVYLATVSAVLAAGFKPRRNA